MPTSRGPKPTQGHAYPRPQLCRDTWISLNGTWEFAVDTEGRLQHPSQVVWADRIEVPFSPETPASGVENTTLFHACWYRRSVTVPELGPSDRVLLHFGAVDYHATVWVNGGFAGHHEGGYTPFSFDMTSYIDESRTLDIVVRAEDDPSDLAKPRGKQDWLRDPHSIWYHRTTGIWQTVWLEVVPRVWLDRIRWTANLERWEIGLAAVLQGDVHEDLRIAVRLSLGDEILADDVYMVTYGEVHRRIALSDPGIDDYRNGLLWNPSSPTLIQAELRLLSAAGALIDRVTSYTALRAIAVDGDRFVLNGRPYQLRLVLDQGYWPATGLTAPDDAALRKDVELAKAMGFNGVRKHQKIEDPRYLYWADCLGLLVWEEMPSAYRFTTDSIHRVTKEWMSAIARDYSHPCIVAWVPFNESWGVPNLPMNAAERHYVRTLYHLTKTLDSTRPVIGNDGWESVATDIIGIHDYDSDPARIAARYHADQILPRLFKRERPAGRLLVLEGERHADQPVVLTEFGGITLAADEAGTWGYSRATSGERLAEQYSKLLTAIHSLGLFSGFCYTQFADTYQEANGLLYADRTPKMPLDIIAAATMGRPAPTPLPRELSDVVERGDDAEEVERSSDVSPP
ncbi:MAG: sugar-binding domain-containing protein [Vicinamibacterales bacterium]